MRSMVCKSYRVWFNSLIKVTRTRSGVATKAEDAAVYTLPASIWELEQQVATESNFASRLNLKHTISLHSFELVVSNLRNPGKRISGVFFIVLQGETPHGKEGTPQEYAYPDSKGC